MNAFTGGALLIWLCHSLHHIVYVKKDPAIDSTVFKSIMIGVATVTAAILRVWFFRKFRTSYTRGQ